jgi:UPF0176 protein
MSSLVVAGLFKFVKVDSPAKLQAQLKTVCQSQGIKGMLLVAPEGLNGTVCGSREAINALKAFLETDGRFQEMEYKESFAETMPFFRLKVRLKKEIVTLGIPGLDATEKAGTYVSPHEWNALLKDPKVLVVDVRNDYEITLGTFEGAVNPHTKTFREIPAYIENQLNPQEYEEIAVCCTGEIRCSKMWSLLKKRGFKKVYNLKGGILKYLEVMPPQDSLWHGECFVFDQRVAVGHQLALSGAKLCHGCRNPLAENAHLSPLYEEGVSCPACYDNTTDEQKNRYRERQKQVKLAKDRKQQHMGTQPHHDKAFQWNF